MIQTKLHRGPSHRHAEISPLFIVGVSTTRWSGDFDEETLLLRADALRVRLLLRLLRRRGWRRGRRGRSWSRGRQQIPDYEQRKDNCRCDDEQPVCVHGVHPLFSLPHHGNPAWRPGTSQTIRGRSITRRAARGSIRRLAGRLRQELTFERAMYWSALCQKRTRPHHAASGFIFGGQLWVSVFRREAQA